MNVEIISSQEQMGFTSVMLSSLRKSLPVFEKLSVFFVTSEPKKTGLLKKQLFAGDTFTEVRINPKSLFSSKMISPLYYGDCLLRVFSPYFLPASVDRLLVLDGDTLIDGKEILDFYSCPFGSEAVVAGSTGNSGTQDGICDRIGIKHGRSINAGSLMINVHRYVESFSLDEMIAKVANLPFDPVLVDQDIINYLFDDKKIILPNQQFNFWVGSVVDESFAKPAFHPCIYHWPGSYKPWSWHSFLHKKYDKRWWHYAFGVLNPFSCLFVLAVKYIKFFVNRMIRRGHYK